ncbi:MAG: hypothetical protein NTW33_00520 [Methanoregula sp.]|nr:hypothetical protein [Methanoregula sp.]
MIHVSEVIRGWLGWCPDRMTALRSGTFKAEYPVSSIPLGEGGFTIQDVIIDYGSTGMSVPVFTIILAGTIAGLFAFMRYGFVGNLSSLGMLLLSIFILGVALRMIYWDIKKPDAITVRRLFSRPIVIAKETVTLIEVRKNIHHSRRWLFRGATAIFFVSVISLVLFREDSQFISRVMDRVSLPVFILYTLSIIVFFGMLFYHAHVRSHRAEVVAICTNNKKIVGLYVDDPGTISDMLSRWRMGAA